MGGGAGGAGGGGEGGGAQIVNGNCGLCQSAADGEQIFKRKSWNDI